jgi:hypothetical protein
MVMLQASSSLGGGNGSFNNSAIASGLAVNPDVVVDTINNNITNINIDADIDESDGSGGNGGGDIVEVPNVNDVLCGRGGNVNSHRGNEQFRALVEKRKRVYLTARFKREKRLIASSIVTEIRGMNPSGRFLTRKGNRDSGHWYDIGDEKARDKTSQALRENAPSIRAEIETEINQLRAETRRGGDDSHYNHVQSSSGTSSASPMVAGSKRPAPSYGAPLPPPHQQHAHYQASSSYAQQYYDYYYHYYGYGAPPPPPPPGYDGGGGTPPAPAPPPPTTTTAAAAPLPPPPLTSSPAGYPSQGAPAPAQYWAPPTDSAQVRNIGQGEGNGPSSMVLQQQQHDTQPSPSFAVGSGGVGINNTNKNVNQEDEDRRMALSLQQEENVKAFEDRNRRYGSDRRSSRSTAFCAPGCRPRLLNDNTAGYGNTTVHNNAHSGGGGGANHHHNHGDHPYTPSRKRPAMSASYYVNSNTPITMLRPTVLPSSTTNPSRDPSDTASLSSQYQQLQQQDNPPLSQEEMDHRIALRLQDQEAHAYIMAKDETARRTSRSNAYIPSSSGALSSSIASPFGGLESMVTSSLKAWTRGAQIAPFPGSGNGGAADSGIISNNIVKGSTSQNDMKVESNSNTTTTNIDFMMMEHQEDEDLIDEDDTNHHHGHDHSLSSLASARSRNNSNTVFSSGVGGGLPFKDDSDMLSLFGEGSTIIPPPSHNNNNNSTTGSYRRLRDTTPTRHKNMMMNSTFNDPNYTPIALEEEQHSQRSSHSRGSLSSSRVQQHNPSSRNSSSHNNSNNESSTSLLSQVANHILGTLGSPWAEAEATTSSSSTSKTANHSNQLQHQQPLSRPQRLVDRIHSFNSTIDATAGGIGGDMETEMGQETVIMEGRDEASMPPPHHRLINGVHHYRHNQDSNTHDSRNTNDMNNAIDWPAQVGCHSWIPETFGASASAFFGQYNEQENNAIQQHHQNHPDDNSLTRQNSYHRNDISPVNSLEMDLSQSSFHGSIGGRSSTRHNNHRQPGGVGGVGPANPSIFSVFDQKNVDPNPEDLLPNIGRTEMLQQVPSWERSLRSRSPLSLGDDDDDFDDSLIRVNSHDVKDRFVSLLANGGNNNEMQQQQQQHHTSNHHQHHQMPMMHQPPQQHQYHQEQNHHQIHHHQGHHVPLPPAQQQQVNRNMHDLDMDWEGDR